jgi:hypothetical protein
MLKWLFKSEQDEEPLFVEQEKEPIRNELFKKLTEYQNKLDICEYFIGANHVRDNKIYYDDMSIETINNIYAIYNEALSIVQELNLITVVDISSALDKYVYVRYLVRYIYDKRNVEGYKESELYKQLEDLNKCQ